MAFCLFLLGSLNCLGLGLGELNVKSFLGEPLEADITILGSQRVDQTNLLVNIVSDIEAERLGIEILYSPIEFYSELMLSDTGNPFIRLFSRQPVTEPYSDLLVHLEWPSGSIYREFAVLLDPPEISKKITPTEAKHPARQGFRAPKKRNDSGSFQSGLVNQGKGAIGYTVKFGDTFSSINTNLSRELSMNARELSNWLIANNSHAFESGDINRLKAGVVLNLPTANAGSTFIEQNDATQPSHKAKPTPVVSAEKTKTASVAKGVLRLSNANTETVDASLVTDSNASAEVAKLYDKLDGTQELLSLVLKENEELKKRLNKLESSKYIDTLKDLIFTQSEQINALRAQMSGDTSFNRQTQFTETRSNVEEIKTTATNESTLATKVEKSVLPTGDNITHFSEQQVSGASSIYWSVAYVVGFFLACLVFFFIYVLAKRNRELQQAQNLEQQTKSETHSIDRVLNTGITDSFSQLPHNEKRKRTLMDIIEDQQREKLNARKELERFSLVEKDKPNYKEDKYVDDQAESKVTSSDDLPEISETHDSIEPLDAMNGDVNFDEGNDKDFDESNIEAESLDIDLVLDDEVSELLSMAEIYCKAHRYKDAIDIIEAQQNIDPDPRLEDALASIRNKIE